MNIEKINEMLSKNKNQRSHNKALKEIGNEFNVEKDLIIIIRQIKNTDFLKRVFWFQSDDPSDFNDMFESEEQKKEFSHIDWLYWSDHPYATLIGIMKNGSIFTIDDEFEQDLISSSFFDIPFVFAVLSVRNQSDPKKSLINDIEYKEDVDDLKKYIQWCIINNNPLKEEYLNYFSS